MKAFVLLLLVLNGFAADAQQYVISTYAGGSPPPTPAAGTAMPIGYPQGIAVDSAGNTYFTSYRCIFKLDPSGVVTRVAGDSRPGSSGDGGPALNAELSYPTALAVDAAGNLFVVDQWRIRKVSVDGIITLFAGNGVPPFAVPPPVPSGDGGPAIDAQLFGPHALAIDADGSLFIADADRVRKVLPDGTMTTVAGGGTLAGPSADGDFATLAKLTMVPGVTVDPAGNLFLIDLYAHRVRRVSPAGIITTVAGNGIVEPVCVAGSTPEPLAATDAELCSPSNLAFDPSGNLLIADSGFTDDAEGGSYTNFAVLKVSPDGNLVPVPGTDALKLYGANAITVDGSGNLFVAGQYQYRISKVLPDGTSTTIAGNGECCYFDFDGAVPAVSAQLDGISSVAADSAGNLFIFQFNVVRRVSPDGMMTTFAKLPFAPLSPIADDAGNLFFVDGMNNRVVKLSTDGTLSTVAGNGTRGDSGDGGPAIDAQVRSMTSLAVDHAGNLFIADWTAFRVRRVSPDGIITTVAGNGTDGYSGDGKEATRAQLEPLSIAVDGAGNLFISDTSTYHIRKVTPDGIITTIAGDGVQCWLAGNFHGDGGPATGANCVNGPLTTDGQGNLFIAGINRIRRISPDGIIDTVAGGGPVGYSGDGGLATNAQISFSFSGITSILAGDAAGDVYIADSSNNVVRVLRPLASQ